MTDQSNPLQISFDDITERYCPNISSLDPQAMVIAGPFFDAGGSTLCLSRRLEHQSGRSRQRRHQFSLMVQGRMTYNFGKKTLIAEPGDLVCIPVGTLRQRTALEPVERIYFDIHDLPLWAPLKKAGPTLRRYESATLMYKLATEVFDAWQNQDLYSLRCACESAGMLVKLLERELYQVSGERKVNRVDSLVDLIAEIRRNPGAAWDRASMADAIGASERHLTYLFDNAFGVSPWKMIIRIRMDHAMMMLSESAESVEKIGQAVGYESIISFSRAFKNHMGMSPGAYRKRVNED